MQSGPKQRGSTTDRAIIPMHADVEFCSCVELHEWEQGIHSFPAWRIYWNAQPGARIRVGRNLFPLDPKHLVVIPPGVESYRELPRPPVTHLYLHASLQPPFHAMTFDRVVRFDPGTRIVTDARWLSEELMSVRGAAAPSPRVSCIAMKLIHTALAQYPIESWPVRQMDDRVVSALRLMQENLGGPVPNSELAEHVGLSVSAFAHLFRTVMDEAPQVHLRRLRLQSAANLLSYTTETIDFIAEVCGFGERNYLSRAFSTAYGVGPATYRNQHQADVRHSRV